MEDWGNDVGIFDIQRNGLIAGETVTSLGATLVESHNVVFVGTASGVFQKILVEGRHQGHVFDSILLDRGVRIIPQIYVQDGVPDNYVIVASLYKVRSRARRY